MRGRDRGDGPAQTVIRLTEEERAMIYKNGGVCARKLTLPNVVQLCSMFRRTLQENLTFLWKGKILKERMFMSF